MSSMQSRVECQHLEDRLSYHFRAFGAYKGDLNADLVPEHTKYIIYHDVRVTGGCESRWRTPG